jgi:hypothetical protein
MIVQEGRGLLGFEGQSQSAEGIVIVRMVQPPQSRLASSLGAGEFVPKWLVPRVENGPRESQRGFGPDDDQEIQIALHELHLVQQVTYSARFAKPSVGFERGARPFHQSREGPALAQESSAAIL